MRNDWKPKKLNELGYVGRGRSRHRPRNDPKLYGGVYPFIQTADIMASELYITKHSQTYNEVGLAQSKLWDKNTLCMTIAGENTAETAILSFPACFPDSIVGFVAHPDKADVQFVKYYLDTIKRQLKSISRGATQDNLSLDKLLSFNIFTPPLQVQHKIAAILSAYDDLIENNTRRIALLEEMARTIYQEWFVRFRYPEYEKEKMVGSELGMIPEGWKVTKLGDYIELAYGKALRTDTRIPGNVPVYGSAGVVGYHNECLVKGPGIIVGRKGNVGSVFWSNNDFYPIDTVFFVRSTVSLYYVYYNLLGQSFINNDAAVPGLSRNQAYLLNFLLPDDSVLTQFQEIAQPIFNQITILKRKNANLQITRALLLPKLISGEIDVEALDIDVPGVIEVGEEEEARRERAVVMPTEAIDATQLALPLM
jgi:type I restriction enzyme, S subunit